MYCIKCGKTIKVRWIRDILDETSVGKALEILKAQESSAETDPRDIISEPMYTPDVEPLFVCACRPTVAAGCVIENPLWDKYDAILSQNVDIEGMTHLKREGKWNEHELRTEINDWLKRLWVTIGCDPPRVHGNILEYMVEDVMDTSDPIEYHDGDFQIAYRRYLEKDYER